MTQSHKISDQVRQGQGWPLFLNVSLIVKEGKTPKYFM